MIKSLLLMSLVGCGSYEKAVEANQAAEKAKADKKAAEESQKNNPPNAPVTETPPAHPESTAEQPKVSPPVQAAPKTETPTVAPETKVKVAALKFSNYSKLKGIARIHSATKINGILYVLGYNAAGLAILGSLPPDEEDPTITFLAKMGTSAVLISSEERYRFATNSSEYLFLYSVQRIVAVDPQTLKAVASIRNGCDNNGTLFSKDGRWNAIWEGTMVTCGKVDGVRLSKDSLNDGATGSPFSYSARTSFIFDGVNLYEYTGNTLNVYNTKFAKTYSYSTSNYLYNATLESNSSAAFVSDGEGNKWMFGCDAKNTCFKAEVTIVTQ